MAVYWDENMDGWISEAGLCRCSMFEKEADVGGVSEGWCYWEVLSAGATGSQAALVTWRDQGSGGGWRI